MEDLLEFKNFIRLSAVDEEDLLCLVGHNIQKQYTVLVQPIAASE